MPKIALGEPLLPLSTLVELSRDGARIELGSKVRSRLKKNRAVVEKVVRTGKTTYGINTGFGRLAGVGIAHDQLVELQRNLLLSHASGVGPPLAKDSSQLAFALRIHNLAIGHSGVRPALLDQAIALFNAGLIPVIPSQGSVGASGDLAPLSHMALPLIGGGEVYSGNRVISGRQALKKLGRPPLELVEKEGLALINGTQVMTAIGCLAVARAMTLARAADVTCAMTVEALRGSVAPFEERVHELRPHYGQQSTAQNLRALLADSAIVESHAECDKVQDAYSLRCAPQVHGASKDGIRFALDVLVTEANSVTDNPLVFADGEVVSAGNFHGQPVSQALDYLAIAVSTLANISERRVEQMVNPDVSGLPPFLAADAGVESGFMIPQVVAASLASENKTLAHPASVDTIPTSASREDHVSMGVIAARHAEQIIGNTGKVLGIEALCAAQGLDLAPNKKLRAGKGVVAAYRAVRRRVKALSHDRLMAPDLAVAEALVADGTLVAAAEKAVGVLAV